MKCTQADIDDWLTLGRTTRSFARGLVRWVTEHGRFDEVDCPYRVTNTEPMISQAERVRLVRQLVLGGTTIEPELRVGGLFHPRELPGNLATLLTRRPRFTIELVKHPHHGGPPTARGLTQASSAPVKP